MRILAGIHEHTEKDCKEEAKHVAESRVGMPRPPSVSLTECFGPSHLISLILSVLNSRMEVSENYMKVIVVKGLAVYLAHGLPLCVP